MLIAEDSDEDFEVLQQMMQQMAVQNPIYRCTHGDKGLDLFYQDDKCADLSTTPHPAVICLN